MKKIITYITVLCIFTACNNDEIGIKYKLTEVIDATGLVSDLVNPYDNTNFFPIGKVGTKFAVRTTSLIYDNDGTLVEKDTVLSESFNDKVTISKMLEAGDYTVVTVVDIVYNDNDWCWKFNDLSKLSTANITLAGKVLSKYGILGFHKEVVKISAEEKSLSIEPEHLGAMYVIYYSNINYSTIRYIYIKYDYNPDTYLFKSNSFIASGTYFNDETLDDEGKYSGYYTNAYFLPNSALKYEFNLYNLNNSSLGDYTIPFAIVSGEHKIVTIDLSQLTFDISPLSKIKTNISDIVRNKSISIDKMGYSLKTNKK